MAGESRRVAHEELEAELVAALESIFAG